jgi:Ribonuclease G/E
VIRILAAKSPGELRIAVLKDDLLEDYAIWRPASPDGLGDIFSGRIIAHVPAMAGAFVALTNSEGFLPDTQSATRLCEGDQVVVRVIRPAQGGKGPRLALIDSPNPPGPTPALISRGESPLHRLARLHPEASIDVDDPALFATLGAEDFATRLRPVPEAFDETLEMEIAALGEAWAELPGGLRAGFFPTPALTAIDMDGAATTAARGSKNEIQFAANRAALAPLARQIRLRNLSGAILVDFAGLPAKRRPALGAPFAEALATDPLHPRLLGFTQLGLAEISRPRTTPPLHELRAGPHAAGLEAMRRLARGLRHAPALRPVLRAAPAVIRALESDTGALADFARLSTYGPVLRSDPTLPGCVVIDEST